MAAIGIDDVSIKINDELQRLCPPFSNRCIFKVHDRDRKRNKEAYEPAALSIGPYHHGNYRLRLMEEHKLWYFQLLLKRRDEMNADRYVIAMRFLVKQALKCYANPIFYDDDTFVKIMLLDGCFIIEFFRRLVGVFCFDRTVDPIFTSVSLTDTLLRDLLLLENQLPFFVLVELFNMTKNPNENLTKMALESFEGFCRTKTEVEASPLYEVRHLLGLIHWSRLPALATEKQEIESDLTKFIDCATELREAGIIFKKGSEGCIFNLNFTNGVLEIPPLHVDDQTESFFRNLIAYEQYDHNNHHFYFTNYIYFMDSLINSPKDVQLLREANTIINWMGDDKAVSNMFNKLGDNVGLHCKDLYYFDTIKAINDHCGKNWNKSLAKLRHNYFNSPWSTISFLAAVTLLLLSTTQTLFSILSYWRD